MMCNDFIAMDDNLVNKGCYFSILLKKKNWNFGPSFNQYKYLGRYLLPNT